ncbi:hypothetical protein BDY21DRAFT_183368 [Lineolata rhizophorae]|uniref:Uncharacterized protein n=1 Tax=Lineolata rhizophorae TaxID=578093 RepID=A0A6A6P7N9_9PEZI|nr:hypothetical protein BDY21DRAFT_183368 [Lineolata rhizophorae]
MRCCTQGRVRLTRNLSAAMQSANGPCRASCIGTAPLSPCLCYANSCLAEPVSCLFSPALPLLHFRICGPSVTTTAPHKILHFRLHAASRVLSSRNHATYRRAGKKYQSAFRRPHQRPERNEPLHAHTAVHSVSDSLNIAGHGNGVPVWPADEQFI